MFLIAVSAIVLALPTFAFVICCFNKQILGYNSAFLLAVTAEHAHNNTIDAISANIRINLLQVVEMNARKLLTGGQNLTKTPSLIKNNR